MVNSIGSLVHVPHCEVTATLEVLQRAEVQKVHLDRLRKDPNFLEDISRIVKNGRGLRPSIPIEEARELLDSHLFGINEWERLFGAGEHFDEVDRENERWFPWSSDILNSPCPFEAGKLRKETHFACYGLPMLLDRRLSAYGWLRLEHMGYSGSDMIMIDPSCHKGIGGSIEILGHNQLVGHGNVCHKRWHLVHLGPARMPNDLEHTILPEWSQGKALPQGYKMCKIIEILTAHVLYHVLNGEPYPGNFMIKTKDQLLLAGQATLSSWGNNPTGSKYNISAENAWTFDETTGVAARLEQPAPLDP